MNLSIETSTIEAPLETSAGSSLQSCKSQTPSWDLFDGLGSKENRGECFYEEHLLSRYPHLRDWLTGSYQTHDYLLWEHRTSGHLVPCDPVSASNADEMVHTAPIREEEPFDKVRYLQPVKLWDDLLGPRHIRLLKLYSQTSISFSNDTLPVRERPQVHCEAYQASLDDLTTTGRPVFVAASYVCGDQTPTQNIHCGQTSIDIPQNAYDVLVHLRLESRPRLIWIDFLCIKQDDSRERSHQVSLLHEIYAQAHVVSWLGTGRGADLEGVSFYLSLFARLWLDEVRADELHVSEYFINFNANDRLKRYFENQVDDPPHEYSLQDLVSVFTADYFKRVWTVQEMILAKTNVCQVGDRLFSLAVITAAAEVLSCIGSAQPSASNPKLVEIDKDNIYRVIHSYLRPALKSRWLRGDTPEKHDLDVVTSLNRGACADPKDYIYGVASLFQESDRYEIDYTLSEAEVFSDFTIHCLMEDPGFDVLNQFRPPTDPARTHHGLRPGLPSWCPDWSTAKRRCDTVLGRTGFGWQASGGHRGANGLLYSRPSRLTLAVEGVIVSRIRLCNATSLRVVQSGDDWRRDLRWFEPRESLCEFFEIQCVKMDHGAKNTILSIFERMIPPKELELCFGLAASVGRVSGELHQLLEQVKRDDLVAVLAPVYLKEVDLKLFEATAFEIDARLPPGDYPEIRAEVARVLRMYGRGTWLFVTENGMQGVGYPGIQQGDLVCIIYGRKEPQILRRVDGDDEERYISMGSCNVDGLMYGEGLEMGLTEREFILV
jgi:hypothetical protein